MLSHCPVDPATLEAFVDGELPAAEHDEMERHVVSCEPCGHVVRTGRALRRIVAASLTLPPVPTELAARVRRDMVGARDLERGGQLPRRARLANAALVLLAIALGFVAGRFSAAPSAALSVATSAPEVQMSSRAIVYPDANRIETVTVLRLPESKP